MGILSLVFLFIAGGIILSRVDLDDGERMAKEFLSKK
jgi:hypothetical protein